MAGSKRPGASEASQRIDRRGPESQTPLSSEGCQLDLQRDGAAALIRVVGHLGAAAHRYLEEVLAWLIDAGCQEMVVRLETIDQLDPACLQILRTARARVGVQGGTLTVVARPLSRTELALTGLTAGRTAPTSATTKRRAGG